MIRDPGVANDELAALIAKRARAGDRDTDEHAREAPSTRPFLLLRLGERWFGLRAEAVREVVARESITRIPGQPAHLRGVAMIHGRMVPVVALDILFRAHDLPLPDTGDAHTDARRRLVVLTDERTEIALLADDARGVVYLPAATRGRGDDGMACDPLRFVLGETVWKEHLVCVLDGDALLAAAVAAGLA